jgi:ankyrin repeat protein
LDINERDEDGQTALKNAVDAANYDKVKALLSHDNIEVEPADSQLWTPLHDAC